MKDQFLELQILSQELWDELKSLRYNQSYKNRKIKKIEAIVNNIKKLDFDTELKLLKEINDVK
jgi:hypothetical protein